MGEDHAFGRPGGAGSVDNRGDVGVNDLGKLGFRRGVQAPERCDDRTRRVHRRRRLAVHRNQRLQIGQPRDQSDNFLQIFAASQRDCAGTRVAQHMFDFIGGTGRVKRHHHRAHTQHSEIRDHPLRAVFGQDCDPIPWLEAQFQESGAHPPARCGDLSPGKVDPGTIAFLLEECSGAVFFGGPFKEMGDGRR